MAAIRGFVWRSLIVLLAYLIAALVASTLLMSIFGAVQNPTALDPFGWDSLDVRIFFAMAAVATGICVAYTGAPAFLFILIAEAMTIRGLGIHLLGGALIGVFATIMWLLEARQDFMWGLVAILLVMAAFVTLGAFAGFIYWQLAVRLFGGGAKKKKD